MPPSTTITSAGSAANSAASAGRREMSPRASRNSRDDVLTLDVAQLSKGSSECGDRDGAVACGGRQKPDARNPTRLCQRVTGPHDGQTAREEGSTRDAHDRSRSRFSPDWTLAREGQAARLICSDPLKTPYSRASASSLYPRSPEFARTLKFGNLAAICSGWERAGGSSALVQAPLWFAPVRRIA